jgi:hypothetical protein
MHLVVALGAFLNSFLSLAGVPQRAPSPEETRLFDQGASALAAGDAKAAEKAWQAGYDIARDPAFLEHIGEAREKAGDAKGAIESYQRYLREAPQASDRADIEQRLAHLGAPVAAASSGAAPPAAGPSEPVGELGGASSAAAPSLPATPAATAPKAAPDGEAPAGTPATPHPTEEEEDSGWNRYNATAFIATGVAVALLGTAAFFGASAASDADDVNRLVLYRNPDTGAPLAYSSVAAQYQRAYSDGQRHDRYAKAAIIGAAGAAAVATVFFVLDAKLTVAPTVSVAPAGDGLAAAGGVAWRF